LNNKIIFINPIPFQKTVLRYHGGETFKGKSQPKPSKKSKQEQLEDKVNKRLESKEASDGHMKSYCTRKAPLYDNYGIKIKYH
jgi:hypothetical protein